MRYLMIILLAITASCGSDTENLRRHRPLVVVGPQGPAGENGTDGSSCSTTTNGDVTAITCTDGSVSYVTNGQSCTITQAANGALITCGDDSVLVLNGTNGMNGNNGVNGTDGVDGVDASPSAYAVSRIIDPCGSESSYDEVLLQLGNGDIIASLSDNASGNNTRFSLIGPGSYVTTDGTSCHFTVNSDKTVTSER